LPLSKNVALKGWNTSGIRNPKGSFEEGFYHIIWRSSYWPILFLSSSLKRPLRTGAARIPNIMLDVEPYGRQYTKAVRPLGWQSTWRY
jgi:hypothetical protein